MPHTQSPWTYYPETQSIWSKRGSCVAQFVLKHNGNLIAAAPDLLAALQQFVNIWVRVVESGDCGFWDPEKDEEVIAARAAISKATGGV